MPDEAKRLPNYERSAYVLVDTVGNRMAYLSAEAFADVAQLLRTQYPQCSLPATLTTPVVLSERVLRSMYDGALAGVSLTDDQRVAVGIVAERMIQGVAGKVGGLAT